MVTTRVRLLWPVLLAALMLLAGLTGTSRGPEAVLRAVSGWEPERGEPGTTRSETGAGRSDPCPATWPRFLGRTLECSDT
ncbi:hypothetical protein [Actinomadura sp. 9N407]|uniref:hypothetical protein n=1 Tax=Actinomadura sp. 9N407 TaxID=3375154 RepID=UPI0037A9DB33